MSKSFFSLYMTNVKDPEDSHFMGSEPTLQELFEKVDRYGFGEDMTPGEEYQLVITRTAD